MNLDTGKGGGCSVPCGELYAGHTGQWTNKRMWENESTLRGIHSGHLVMHSDRCRTLVSRSLTMDIKTEDKTSRKMKGAFLIMVKSMSAHTINMLLKELTFLQD